MKTLNNLTATISSQTIETVLTSPSDIHSTQSQKGFWRRVRVSKDGTFLESSKGGSVFVPHAELWKLCESHDSNLCRPKS